MAKSLNSILKAICANSLGELLLADGFEESPAKIRNSILTAQYHQLAVDRLCVVDVQRDKSWTNGKGRFCVNLCIYFPEVGDFSGMDAMAAMSNSAYFRIHERLGQLAAGSDYWWELKRGWFFSESREVDRISSDLRQKWLSFGRPWIESISDLRAARDRLAMGWSKGMAIRMSLALGEIREARELMIDLLCLRYRPPEDVLAKYEKWRLISSTEATALQRLLMQREDVLQNGLKELFGRSQPRHTPIGH